MQTPFRPDFCFSSEDAAVTASHLLELEVAGRWPPKYVDLDGRRVAETDPAQLLQRCNRQLMLDWAPEGGIIDYAKDDKVRLGWPEEYLSIAALRDLLQQIPFRWMSASTISSQWGPEGQPTKYIAPGFLDGHYDHGWVCAFKGAGHDQLVSRRWLDYGPWRLVRGESDLSLVQFHDLEVDDAVALNQAKPGHRCMGVTPEGGFIPPPPISWRHGDLRKLYDPATGLLMVVVYGRQVTQEEMLEACAIRRYQPLDVEVRNLAFVFMQERDARDHLHDLWLRGLECRALIDGKERRLDEEYVPAVPVVPDWVKRVQDREGF
ncbi:MAG: hypothetical protein P8103_08225 [Candidatus Thiodiazotropha sp.]